MTDSVITAMTETATLASVAANNAAGNDAAGAQQWAAICALDDILPDTGVCALVDGRHVAIFRVGDSQLFAIDNIDPKSQASVLSRGLVGNLGESIVVASPLYKNHFDLRTGACLEMPEHSVRAYAVRVESDRVLVARA